MTFSHDGGFCYVRKHKGFIIVTEPLCNKGKSITNSWPQLQGDICATLNLDPHEFHWIEHYERRSPDEDTYDLVTITGKGICWTLIPISLATMLFK